MLRPRPSGVQHEKNTHIMLARVGHELNVRRAGVHSELVPHCLQWHIEPRRLIAEALSVWLMAWRENVWIVLKKLLVLRERRETWKTRSSKYATGQCDSAIEKYSGMYQKVEQVDAEEGCSRRKLSRQPQLAG